MPNGDTDNVVQATAVRAYPEPNSADPAIQQQMQHLWESGRKFIILSGPPGVGKTRAAEDMIIETLAGLEAAHDQNVCRLSTLFPDFRNRVYTDEEIREVLTQHSVSFVWDISVLHPQYTYEDLIRGYRLYPGEGGVSLQVRDGILGHMCRVLSVLESMSPSVSFPRGTIVLDEINRAPIGQLFGEAIYGLDRRGESVSTPYELDGVGCGITFPESLLLLGTMNSVDRATAGFDFALRRRFTLVNMYPDEQPIRNYYEDIGARAGQMAVGLFEALKQLIMTSDQCGVVPKNELVLGHAYFIAQQIPGNEESAINWLAESYMYRILPTLVDYKEQGLIEYKAADVAALPLGQELTGDAILDGDRLALVLASLELYIVSG